MGPIEFLITQLCLALLVGAPVTSLSSSLESRLKADLEGKTVTIRSFYQDSKLRFGPDGVLIGGAKSGAWTLHGRVQVKRVSLSPTRLEIYGDRVGVEFDHLTQESIHRLLGKDVEILIDLPTSLPPDQAVAELLSKVFVGPDTFEESVPPPWRHFVRRLKGKLPQSEESLCATKGNPVGSSAPGKPSPPKRTKESDPKYTKQAQRAAIQGTTLLKAVIDESGVARELEICKAIGYGLDEEAMRAVERWRFQPGTLDGKPVSVVVNIEVNFRLYR